MLLPSFRIIVITYLKILAFHCFPHIIYHSINHIIICYLRLWCIWTIWRGLNKTKNIIIIRSIYKEIITGRELLWKNQVVILTGSGYTVPQFGEISINWIRLWTNLYTWKWVIMFSYGNQKIVPNTIAPHLQISKASHKCIPQSTNWSNLLHLFQGNPSNICTK